jgi:hypothetical protein
LLREGQKFPFSDKIERQRRASCWLHRNWEAKLVDAAEKIKPEEGFAVLRKWREEYTPLRAYFSFAGFGADFTCSVADISGTLLTLNLEGLSIAPWFELKGCLFSYGDPPAAIAAQPSLSGRSYESALLVRSFTGTWSLAVVQILG